MKTTMTASNETIERGPFETAEEFEKRKRFLESCQKTIEVLDDRNKTKFYWTSIPGRILGAIICGIFGAVVGFVSGLIDGVIYGSTDGQRRLGD